MCERARKKKKRTERRSCGAYRKRARLSEKELSERRRAVCRHRWWFPGRRSRPSSRVRLWQGEREGKRALRWSTPGERRERRAADDDARGLRHHHAAGGVAASRRGGKSTRARAPLRTRAAVRPSPSSNLAPRKCTARERPRHSDGPPPAAGFLRSPGVMGRREPAAAAAASAEREETEEERTAPERPSLLFLS